MILQYCEGREGPQRENGWTSEDSRWLKKIKEREYQLTMLCLWPDVRKRCKCVYTLTFIPSLYVCVDSAVIKLDHLRIMPDGLVALYSILC